MRLIKKPVSAFLKPELPRELKALRARTMEPQPVYVRGGLDLVLAKYAQRGG